MGEFVFDHSWADYAQKVLGIAYYPKLLSAVPFTPGKYRQVTHYYYYFVGTTVCECNLLHICMYLIACVLSALLPAPVPLLSLAPTHIKHLQSLLIRIHNYAAEVTATKRV
jgi:hypothetical protein